MSKGNFTVDLNSRMQEIKDYDFDVMLKNIQKYNGKTGPEIDVNGERGAWLNKEEEDDWDGDIPLDQYEINADPNPIIIYKKNDNELVYDQETTIKYLKPPTPIIGDIIVEQEPDIISKPQAPIILRQIPHPEKQKEEELVYRELPPIPPKKIERQVVKIPGKKLPPPPRKVIVEILPQVPSKPRPVILERWLTPKPVKRRVIYERAPPIPQQKLNDKPEIIINKKYYFINSSELEVKNEKDIDKLLESMAVTSSKPGQIDHSKDRRRQTEKASKKETPRSLSNHNGAPLTGTNQQVYWNNYPGTLYA